MADPKDMKVTAGVNYDQVARVAATADAPREKTEAAPAKVEADGRSSYQDAGKCPVCSRDAGILYKNDNVVVRMVGTAYWIDGKPEISRGISVEIKR